MSKGTAPPEFLDQVIRHAESLVEQVFPVPPDTVAAVQRRFPGAVLLGWGNEGESGTRPALVMATDSRALGVTGTLLDWSGAHDLLNASSMRDTAHRMPGCFAALRIEPGAMTAVTDMTRACGVFYAETPELHIVGTRALLVHLVARDGRTIDWDVPALQSMVRQGYFLSDETPFEGVRALPPATTLEIRDGIRKITSVPLPGSGPVPESRRGKRDAIEGLAEALIETVRPLTDQVNLALTGGRDSRLMAALLHAAKVPFRVTTNGLDDHPDVVIARRIAAKLGVEHTVIPPKRTEQRDAVLVEHPLRRTFEVLRTCEGMTSAYETIVEYLPYSSRLTMSGQSGEILRGGFLYSQGNPAPKAMRRRVDVFFLKDEALFTEDANAHARRLAAPWQERAMTDPAQVLDHMYVTYRVGRWHAAARAGSLRRGDAVQPFLDNRVVAAALALDPMWRRSEEVVHELIGMFAPQLRRIPIEGAEWRFMAERTPSRWESLLARRQPPAPAAQKKGAGGWNWRTSPGEQLTAVLREGVLDGDVLWDIVRKDAVEDLFAAPAVKQPALAWNLYTVGAMLSGLYPGSVPDDLTPVEVRIPRA
ncbi:asparagine synthase-related protein [Microtetraspora sp. NBRC 16547]|uniref:asparagine synthase-related protein n=1 Tax=Microtetraspora sp. NBRC 16547 TaxID=3030993 RepID=UPI0025565692|nr:asparagine synthase-related protein [Microtetraspora sp. NBRC 16547]